MCLSFATEIFDEPSNQFHGRTIYFIKKISLDDFPFSDDYLLERVKKGIGLGYTFKQCCEHWLKDFEIALYNTKIEVPEEEGAIFSYHEFLFNLQEIMLSKVILCGSILVLWSLAHLFLSPYFRLRYCRSRIFGVVISCKTMDRWWIRRCVFKFVVVSFTLCDWSKLVSRYIILPCDWLLPIEAPSTTHRYTCSDIK